MLIPYSFLDKLRRRVIRCTDIPVLLYVGSQVNVNKGYAYPSPKKIVKETGLAMRCVCGALKALAAAGLLYIEKCLKVRRILLQLLFLPAWPCSCAGRVQPG